MVHHIECLVEVPTRVDINKVSNYFKRIFTLNQQSEQISQVINSCLAKELVERLFFKTYGILVQMKIFVGFGGI